MCASSVEFQRKSDGAGLLGHPSGPIRSLYPETPPERVVERSHLAANSSTTSTVCEYNHANIAAITAEIRPLHQWLS
jgi:hypothetical protein